MGGGGNPSVPAPSVYIPFLGMVGTYDSSLTNTQKLSRHTLNKHLQDGNIII